MSKKRTVTLDVREDIKRGREPFSRIMQAVASLGAGDDLVIIAPFEPTPLYAILAQRGFSHRLRRSNLETGRFALAMGRSKRTRRNPHRIHSSPPKFQKSRWTPGDWSLLNR